MLQGAHPAASIGCSRSCFYSAGGLLLTWRLAGRCYLREAAAEGLL